MQLQVNHFSVLNASNIELLSGHPSQFAFSEAAIRRFTHSLSSKKHDSITYNLTGCGLLFGGIWKLSGAQSFEDFRRKAGNILPVIPKKPSEGRTEFSGE